MVWHNNSRNINPKRNENTGRKEQRFYREAKRGAGGEKWSKTGHGPWAIQQKDQAAEAGGADGDGDGDGDGGGKLRSNQGAGFLLLLPCPIDPWGREAGGGEGEGEGEGGEGASALRTMEDSESEEDVEEEEAFMVLATAMWLSPDSTEEALVTSLRSEKRSSSLLRKSMAFLVGAGMEEEIRAPAPAPWLDLGVWKVWERGKPGRFAEGLAVCQKGRPWLWRPLLWLKLG